MLVNVTSKIYRTSLGHVFRTALCAYTETVVCLCVLHVYPHTVPIAGLLCVFSDRDGLTDRRAVSKLQGLFLQAMYYYMQKRTPGKYP